MTGFLIAILIVAAVEFVFAIGWHRLIKIAGRG